MCERTKKIHRVLCVFIFLMPFMCGSCLRAKPSQRYIYRLSKGGYSPTTNNLLYVVHGDLGEEIESVHLLAMYDEDNREVKCLRTPISTAPSGWAWSPKENVFVTAHGDRMSLFQKDATYLDGYTGRAIGCPLGFYYRCFSWSPNGDWLAVNCMDMREPSLRLRLGLYRFGTKQFTISDISIYHNQLFWKDETTLYVPNENIILEVSIDSGAPKIINTIPMEKDFSSVYGVFGGEVLIQKDSQIKLGNRILIELERDVSTPVITTEELIFVLSSLKNLVVFDHQGNELSRINPERKIRFGSVGKDPNSVYALAGSMLLRVCVENGDVRIQEVYDLADF